MSVATIPDVMQDMAESTYRQQVYIVADTQMHTPPWLFEEEGWEKSRLKAAIELVCTGKVTESVKGWSVAGSKTPYFLYRETMACPCKAAEHGKTAVCKHRVAVELARRVQQAYPQNTPLPLPPVTVDDRLAQAAQAAMDHVSDALPVPQEDRIPGAAEGWTGKAVQFIEGVRHEEEVAPIAAQRRDTEAPTMPQEDRMPDDEYRPEPDDHDAPTAILERPTPEPARVTAAVAAGHALLPSLAMPCRSIQAIIADLSRPLPAGCVASKTQGGQAIAYLHWQTVARVLDAYAPGWHGQVTRVDQVGRTCAITYRLTIPCLEGTVYREATGQEEEEVKGYGDTTSNAEAMAMKRAAAKFGLGAWLYDKDSTAPALAAHLKEEKTQAMEALGARLDTLGRDRQTTLAWLKTQTGAQRNSDIPLGAIRALLMHLSAGEGQ